MQLKYRNAKGDELDLVNNQNYFVLIGADNLHGVEISYSESDSPYIDGTTVDNARAMPRGILLTFQLVGDVQSGIDRFTGVVKSKQKGTLYETDENGREIVINGVSKVPPYTRVSAACQIQLELYCGQPYWEDVETIIAEIKAAIDLLYFPKNGRPFPVVGVPFGAIDTSPERTLHNDGDAAVGLVISIIATAATRKPRISCSTGTQNGWYMEVDVALAANDELVISTVRGNKYIRLNGSPYVGTTPLLKLLTVVGDDWLQLEQGFNTFNISASNGGVYFNLAYKRRYE